MNLGGYNSLSKLADSGVLGLLLAIAIIAIIYLFRTLLSEKDREIKDKEAMNVTLRSVDETMKEIIVEIEHNHRDDCDHEKRKR